MPEGTNGLRSLDVTIQGKRVHVHVAGSGPGLLLFHSAWGDASLSWSSVWNNLSTSFTVIAPDMPGFGASEPIDHPSLAASSRVMGALLENLKIDDAIVLGNSFGAALAVEFSNTFPMRTRHLVLVNGTNMPIIPAFLKKIISLPIIEGQFRSIMRKATYSNKAFAKSFPDRRKLPKWFFGRIREHEEKISSVVFDTFMNQAGPQKQPSVPSTIIWGMGDRLVSSGQLEGLKKWLNKPAFVPIEGAGHMPQIERPDAFVDAVKRIRT